MRYDSLQSLDKAVYVYVGVVLQVTTVELSAQTIAITVLSLHCYYIMPKNP